MWLRDYHVDGAAARRRARAGRRLAGAPARGAGRRGRRRCRRTCGRPLTLIAESDLNDPRLVTPREARRLRAGRAVERRLPPRAARRADRRDDRLLRRLRSRWRRWPRSARGASSTTAPGRPSAGATTGCRSTRDRLPTWRLVVCQPEPRPDRQPRARRPADRACSTTTSSRCAALLTLCRPVHADALHGRGVGGVDAVPVLHLPPRAGARRGDGRGPDRGVRADGLGPGASCPTRRTPRRSSAPSSTGPSSSAGRHAVLLDVYRRLAALRRAAARAHRPRLRTPLRARPTSRPGSSPCAGASCSSR